MRDSAPTAASEDAERARSVEALGAEVRQLRKTRGLTLDDLSRASGMSLSHLSAIERGTVNASLDKLTRIAMALDVPMAWFFTRRAGDGPLEQAYVVRSENRRSLNMLYGESPEELGYSDWLLSSTIGGKWHMGVAKYGPGSGKTRDALYAREGELHAVVLEGELELQLEDEIVVLRCGDSFSFPGEIPHALRNKSDHPAQLLWIDAGVVMRKDALLEQVAGPEGKLDRVRGE